MPQAIAVVGIGYIGLPLSLTFCEKGQPVIGVDVNQKLVDDVNRGYTRVMEDYKGETLEVILQRNLSKGLFRATTDYALAAKHVDTYLVAVGIPVGSEGELDATPLMKATDSIGQVVKAGDLILYRSTVIPGVIEHSVIPRLEEVSGLTAGKDFHVAYAAERVAEGRAIEEFQTLDIVAAGYTEACTDRAVDVLSRLTRGTIHRTNLFIAQAVKVVENAQRDVNIALAQEVAQFAEYHDVDVFELIRMANTHPRVKLLEPGIGVGGFCIPNAYHYMRGSLAEGQFLPLFDLARAVNHGVPKRIVERLDRMLQAEGKRLHGSTIAVLGLGMKDFSNDIRLSPALDVVDMLQQAGATVRAYDPTVEQQLDYQTASLETCLAGADGLVIATWQREFEQMNFADAMAKSHIQTAIIDIKHRLRGLLNRDVAGMSGQRMV